MTLLTANQALLARALDAGGYPHPEGLHQLQQACAPSMLAVARHCLQDAPSSEDVVHDTLLLAWLNAHRLHDDETAPGPWLLSILGRRIASQLDAMAGRETRRLHQLPPGLAVHSLWSLAETLDPEPPSAALSDRLQAALAARLEAFALPRTPNGELVHAPLYDSSLRRKMLVSRLAFRTKGSFKQHVGGPVESMLFRRWLAGAPGSQSLERQGLPRRSVEAVLGERLELNVEPRRLRRIISFPASFPNRVERRQASNQFIWSGDWDLPLQSMAENPRTRFIQDIWRHRLAPERSDTYRALERKREQGRPLRSHHKGMLLDSRERILEYLRLYLLHMQGMACFGFDKRAGKDRLGVVIDRHGRIVKVNKGLHRLAMAQALDLAEVTVSVRGVHRQWWEKLAGTAQGEMALKRIVGSLQACEPAD